MSDTAVVETPRLGTPEYDAMVLKRAEDNNVQVKMYDGDGQIEEDPVQAVDAEKPAPVRPDDLPEKFWVATDEDPVKSGYARLAKSYAELEKSKQVRAEDGKFKSPAEQKEELKAATPEDTNATDAQKAVESAGMDWDALTNEYQQNGALTEDTLAKLEKGGIPKHITEAYIEGQKALGEKFMQTAYANSGGTAESYKAMVAWAGASLSQSEIKAFDQQVTGSTDSMQVAVKGLYARYQAAVGSQPKHMEMGGNTKTVSDVYTSMEDLSRDTRNPKYRTDPKFRAMVEAKADRSNF